jgi:hypothetical protein
VHLQFACSDCSLATAEQHTNRPFSFGIFHTKRRDFFFDVGNEQDMIEWVQCIENALGVGQSGVGIEDFELLTMVGKGSYGRVIQVYTSGGAREPLPMRYRD